MIRTHILDMTPRALNLYWIERQNISNMFGGAGFILSVILISMEEDSDSLQPSSNMTANQDTIMFT